MDVVLGVAVTGPVARLALVGAGAAHDVIDQSVVDLADHPIETLTQTVVGTNRLLADESHRLVATRLCWTDFPKADQLRRALEDSGVHDIAVLSESQAATALMRAAGRPGAVLVMDDETATLSIVGSVVEDEHAPPTLLASGSLTGNDASATFDTLMARLGDQPDAAGDLYLVGASAELTQVAEQIRDASTIRVEIADDPTFALARGAALSAGDATAMAPAVLTGDETTIAPAAQFADPNAQDQQLAYSMAGFPSTWTTTTTTTTIPTPRRARCGSAAAHCSSATPSSPSRSSVSRRWLSRWRSRYVPPRLNSPWSDSRTLRRESSCRCCPLSNRRRYRRPRLISRMPDTKAASFRTPTATFRRS